MTLDVEMFLDPSAVQALQYLYDPAISCCSADSLEHIDLYHERIRMFHVKDAEFNPRPAARACMAVQSWIDRGRTLPLAGRRQVNFKAIFSKLTQYHIRWRCSCGNCCLSTRGRRPAEGAKVIADHIIRVTDKAFDDFAGAGADVAANRRMLGVG